MGKRRIFSLLLVILFLFSSLFSTGTFGSRIVKAEITAQLFKDSSNNPVSVTNLSTNKDSTQLINGGAATGIGISTSSNEVLHTAKIGTASQQVFKGWGAFMGFVDWYNHSKDNEPCHELIYEELGADFARVKLYPSYGNPDGTINTENIDYALAKQLQDMKEHGMTKWILVPWTPPTYMKTNNSTSHGSLKEDMEDEFARYYVDVLKYLRDAKGLGTPIGVSIQNELTYDAPWDGCVYTKEQWYRVAKLLRTELDKAGMQDVKIMGPESGSLTGSSDYLGDEGFPAFYNDPELNKAVGYFASHGYSQWSLGPVATKVRDSVKKVREELGKDAWMTEWNDEDRESEDSEVMINARRIARDLGYIGYNYYCYWNIYHPNKPDAVNGYDNKTRKLYYFLQRLYHSVRPGYIVKNMTTTDPDLIAYGTDEMDMLAFQGESSMAVLLTNPTAVEKKLKVQGLTGTKLQVFQTTSTDNMDEKGFLSIDSGSAIVTLPSKSVIIAVTNGGTLPLADDGLDPQAPVNLRAERVKPSEIKVAWEPASIGKTVQYYVYQNDTRVAVTDRTCLTARNLQHNTSYNFKVYAIDEGFNISQPTKSITVSTPPDTMDPLAPTGLRARGIKPDKFEMVWTQAVDDDRITQYMVYKDGVLAVTVPGTITSLTNLKPNTTYKITVQAQDAVGKLSPMSQEMIVTTAELPPVPVFDVLLVTGGSMSNGDKAVKARLERMGLSVVQMSDSAVTSNDATNKKLVIVSSSVGSGNISTKFRDSAVPVIVWESHVMDDMKMTADNDASRQKVAGKDSIVILNHYPLSAGLSGTVKVINTAGDLIFGVPNENAIRVAAVDGDSGKSHIYIYEKDSVMMDGFVAPEKRIGFFLTDNTLTDCTQTGLDLFDAAVNWAMQQEGSGIFKDVAIAPGVPGSYKATSGPDTEKYKEGTASWKILPNASNGLSKVQYAATVDHAVYGKAGGLSYWQYAEDVFDYRIVIQAKDGNNKDTSIEYKVSVTPEQKGKWVLVQIPFSRFTTNQNFLWNKVVSYGFWGTSSFNNKPLWVDDVKVIQNAPRSPGKDVDSPSGFKAQMVTSTSTELKWNLSATQGVMGYKVYRDGVEIADVTTGMYKDTGLTPGATYNYTVKAYKLTLYSDPTPVVSVKTLVDDSSYSTAAISSVDQQEIKGWGTHTGFYEWYKGANNNQTFFNNMYRDFGVDLIRLKVYDAYGREGADGKPELDKDRINSQILAQMAAMKANGITSYILVPWSPPGYMKTNNSNNGAGTLKPEYEDDFVQYYVEFIKYIVGQGYELPMGISIQNEVSYAAPWDGCAYTTEQYYRVTKMMRKVLDENGFKSVKIMGPESGSFEASVRYLGGEDLSILDKDTEFTAALGAIALHSYGDSSGAFAEEARRAVQNAKARGYEIWSTEWSPGAGNELENAITIMRHVGRDLGYMGFDYWVGWGGWHPVYDGNDYTNGPEDSLDHIRTKLYYPLQKLFHSAPKGYKVRLVTEDEPELKGFDTDNIDMIAFHGDKSTVMVLCNQTNDWKNVAVEGLTGTEAEVFRLTAVENMDSWGKIQIPHGKAMVQLPAKSVVLLETNSGAPSPDTQTREVSSPTNLKVSGKKATSVELAWDASIDSEKRMYYIYANDKRVGSAMGTAFRVTGLTQNTNYKFTVRTVDSLFNLSPESTAVYERTLEDVTPPSVPQDLTAKDIMFDKVTLEWTQSVDEIDEVGEYNIYQNGNYVGTTTATYFTVKGLVPETAYSFELQAKDITGNLSAKTEPVTLSTKKVGYQANKAATAPVVDGEIDKIWDAQEPTEITRVLTGTVNGSTDLSGKFKVLWNEEGLYLLAQVTDDVQKNDSTDHNDDNVEVYLDIGNDKGNIYGPNDEQFRFGWNDTEFFSLKKAEHKTGVKFAQKDWVDGYNLTRGYNMEIMIPWSTFEAGAKNGTLVGFDIHITDDDDGGARDKKIGWFSAVDDNWRYPYVFGTIQLKDGSDTIPPVTTAKVTGEPINGWYKSDVTIELSATDDGTGIRKTRYSLDGGEYVTYSGAIVLSSEGSHIIRYLSEDNAGNVELEKSIEISVDKTAPTFVLMANNKPVEGCVCFEDSDLLSFTLTTQDGLSGVDKKVVIIDGEPYMEGTAINYAGRLGSHAVNIEVEDKAGNTTKSIINFEITTSIASMRKLITNYIVSGDLKGPLVPQLSNALDQAEHHLSKGRKEQASKHMENYIKHLNNRALEENITPEAKAILDSDAKYLITLWMN